MPVHTTRDPKGYDDEELFITLIETCESLNADPKDPDIRKVFLALEEELTRRINDPEVWYNDHGEIASEVISSAYDLATDRDRRF